MNKKYKSDAMAAIHETMSDLHCGGAIDKKTMRRFDVACLTPIRPLKPKEIKAIREKEHVSQTVFANYLNVTSSLVSKMGTRGKSVHPGRRSSCYRWSRRMVSRSSRSYLNILRCSLRMHLSITTSNPASRARNAAASLTTPSCIHTAFAPDLDGRFDNFRRVLRLRRNTLTMSIFSGTSSSRA